MNNYYFYLIMFFYCSLPFIICVAWYYALKNCKSGKKPAPNPVDVNSILFKEYRFLGLSANFNSLLTNLKLVKTKDPAKRKTNKADDWFKCYTPEISHDGMCLAYINYHNALEDTFWKNMIDSGMNPEEDEEFQYLLISAHPLSRGVWGVNFYNLLGSFGKRWKLLPKVEELLNTDPRLDYSSQVYRLARKHAQ